MKTLADEAARAEIAQRLGRLTPDAERRWGTLTANEMLCHLADAFDRAMRGGGKKNVPAYRRTVVKWVALYVPIHWPRGIRGPATADPRREGTRPRAFDQDRQRAEKSLEAFAADSAKEWATHPLFGPLTRGQWMRWGYLHADHHLRQFGV